MRIPIRVFSFGSVVPKYVGYIELDVFDANECWHLCNWSQWTTEKPSQLHSEIDTCGHGICFTNPETGEHWLAKSFGWLRGDLTEVCEYVKKNKNSVMWR